MLKYGIGVMVAATVVVVMLTIWRMEERKQPVQATAKQEFSYQLEKTDQTGDLLLTCSEEIMSKPVAEFARWLKIDGPPVQLPSGHMLIARLNDMAIPEELKASQRVVVELLKRASPKRIVLVAHTNCVYYDTVAAWQNDLMKVREKQITDLKATAKVVQDWLPKSVVELYLAEEENGQLVFHKI